MNPTEVLGFILALLVMLAGVVGAVLPALPGTPLIFLAALAHRLWFGNHSASWLVVVALAVLAAFSMVMDFVATTYGAKRLGSTWRGMTGAVVGAMLGLFILPPFGLVLLPLIGASLAEILGGREWKEAGKAGIGASLGVLAGTLGKVGCSLAMVALWMFNLLWRLFGSTTPG
ncbi:MAG: hypothetical protein RIS76_174 [Verrucomicrobiota bacterium]|jgi:uncharacterized protein YqgC (DUF456 family)